MKYAVFSLMFLLAGQAISGDVQMRVENFRKHENGSLEIVLKFTNNTAHNVSFVRASCAFLDGTMRAVTTENVIAENIPIGASAYGKSYVLDPGDAEKADCRITAVD